MSLARLAPLLDPENGGARGGASDARKRFERIYHDLRDRICLLEYPPGARVSEEELAEVFSVSRTPIRRVLTRLEAEGMVEARHGVGTIVTDVGLDALEQVFQLRMELAVLIGRLSPLPRRDGDFARIRSILTRCDELSADPTPDPTAFARLNMAFFHELSAMIGNQPLRELTELLYFQTFRIWLQSVPRLNLADEASIFRREMADILAAMEIGDLEAVGHIRRSHISMSFMRIRRYSAEG